MRTRTSQLFLSILGVSLLGCAANLPADGIFDWDGDGFGTSDCDDGDATIHPGADERCDDKHTIDENCDTLIDDESPIAPTNLTTFFRDQDDDGFGDPEVDDRSCAPADGFVADNTDCDDEDADVNPGAQEVCDSKDVDEDCDGKADDEDDDAEGRIPAYVDEDGDEYGVSTESALFCVAPDGYAEQSGDCDDGARAIHPGADEECDHVDNDCDGGIDDDDPQGTSESFRWYADEDGDGVGGKDYRKGCFEVFGETDRTGDCDDHDSTVHPGATEVCNDGVDQDCDGGSAPCFLEDDDSLTRADFSIPGTAASEYLGYLLAAGGDSDGDGQEEVWAQWGGLGGGGVARITGTLADDHSVDDRGLVTVVGVSTPDFGFAIAAGTDLDGDGLPDLVVSSPNKDDALTNSGTVYIFAAPLLGGEDESDALATVRGDETNDYAGQALAVGDSDGDGQGDLFLTQPNDGNVVGLFGPFVSGESFTTATHDVVASGAVYQRIVLGDLDGDGADELVIGDYGYSRLYVYAGGDKGTLSSTNRVATLDTDTSSISLGWSVAVGDYTGDGYGDVAGGAPEADSETGAVYVLTAPVSGSYTDASTDLILTGAVAGSYLGWSVALGGDGDDDGDMELVVGATRDDTQATSGGAVYVFDGSPLSGQRTTADASSAIYEGRTSAQYGAAVAAADLDGDGVSDLVTAAFSPSALASAGGIYGFYGSGY